MRDKIGSLGKVVNREHVPSRMLTQTHTPNKLTLRQFGNRKVITNKTYKMTAECVSDVHEQYHENMNVKDVLDIMVSYGQDS